MCRAANPPGWRGSATWQPAGNWHRPPCAWWPIALVAAAADRRARFPVAAAFLGPAMVDAARSRSLRPLLDAPLVTADQMAYGAGVWAGVVAEREVGPLLPSFTNWPQRNGG